MNVQQTMYRRSYPGVFLRKSVLKVCSKFTGEHQLQLYCNCTSLWVFFCKFAAYFQNAFSYEHLCAAASEYRKYAYTKSCSVINTKVKSAICCSVWNKVTDFMYNLSQWILRICDFTLKSFLFHFLDYFSLDQLNAQSLTPSLL